MSLQTEVCPPVHADPEAAAPNAGSCVDDVDVDSRIADDGRDPICAGF